MQEKKMIKTAASFILAAVLTLHGGALLACASGTGAKASIVMDARTGGVLFEKNADEKLGIASTTKIMTALVALETADLESVVTVTDEAEGVEGTSLYLKAGERLPVRELLYGLLLESGNDAAVALAIHVSGSVRAFVGLMNEKAAALGCKNTHFANPSGLPAEEHYSTARDLAVIMAAAMENEEFVRMSSTKTVSFGTRSFKNHNRLLWSCDGVIAGKTGYTKSSGRTLVTCAERDGMRLICVTLDDPDDWDDHAALYDELFGKYIVREICRKGEGVWTVPVVSGTERYVAAAPDRDVSVTVPRGSTPEIIAELPKFVYAEVREGEPAGRLRVMDGGVEIASAVLVYAATVGRDDSQLLTLWEKVRRDFSLIS